MPKVTISFEGESVNDLMAQVQDLFATVTKTGATETKGPGRKRTTKEEAVFQTGGAVPLPPAEPITVLSPVVSPDPAAVTDAVATATMTEIAEIIPKVLIKLGKPVIVAVLAEFGVKKGTDLTPAQYGPFLRRANAVLAGTEAVTLAV